MGKRPPRSIRKYEMRTAITKVLQYLARISQSPYRLMPVKKDSEQHYYKSKVPSNMPAKHLRDSESQYSNIEQDMLTVLFGLEWFHYYAFRCPVTVDSDNKPLESIFQETPEQYIPTPQWNVIMHTKVQCNNQVHTRKRNDIRWYPILWAHEYQSH